MAEALGGRSAANGVWQLGNSSGFPAGNRRQTASISILNLPKLAKTGHDVAESQYILKMRKGGWFGCHEFLSPALQSQQEIFFCSHGGSRGEGKREEGLLFRAPICAKGGRAPGAEKVTSSERMKRPPSPPPTPRPFCPAWHLRMGGGGASESPALWPWEDAPG